MRVIIIDDEIPSITLMKMIMSKNKYIEIIGEYTDAKKALPDIIQLIPEAVFVDIEMPHMSGIELALEVKQFNQNIQIVFVTAYDQYALKAFDVNAVNYILKPMTEDILNITVNRLLRNYSNQKQSFMQSNDMYKIMTLGNFEVYGNEVGKKVQWATTKTKELFAYFVLERGREIDKWKLCDILYPKATMKNAEHSLHSTISRTKASLKEAGIENIIHCNKGKYRIDLESFSCDLWEWEDFVKNNPIITMENISYYERIIEIYRGELFSEEDFVWSFHEKERNNRNYLNNLKKIATYFIKLNNYKGAIKYLERYIQVEPYDEDMVELLMRAYFFHRNKSGIIDLYHNLHDTLRKELNITPRESLDKLYHELLLKL